MTQIVSSLKNNERFLQYLKYTVTLHVVLVKFVSSPIDSEHTVRRVTTLLLRDSVCLDPSLDSGRVTNQFTGSILSN